MRESSNSNEATKAYLPIVAPRLPPGLVQRWLEKGFTYATMQMWVSNISEQEAATLFNLVADLSQNCYFQYGKLSEPQIADTYALVPHFEDKFEASFELRRRAYRGNYLRIFIPSRSLAEINMARRTSVTISNRISMLFGVSALAQNVYHSDIELKSGKYIGNSRDTEYSEPFGNGREVDAYLKNTDLLKLKDSAYRKLSDLGNELLHQALENFSNDISFYYLWSTLEVEVGNGKSRARFCSQTLKSDILNAELKRLHTVRSDMAHDGRFDKITGRDKFFCLEFIRLHLLKSDRDRASLVKRLEKLTMTEAEILNLGGEAPHLDILFEPIMPPSFNSLKPGPIKRPFDNS